jgi:hypothetical protein
MEAKQFDHLLKTNRNGGYHLSEIGCFDATALRIQTSVDHLLIDFANAF